MYSLERNKFAISPQFNRLRRHLSAIEIDIIFKIATMIDKNDQDFKDYEMNFNDFEKSIGKRINRDFFDDKIALSLMQPFQIREEEKSTKTLALFSCLEYDRSTFQLKARFDKSMKPFFLDLKQFIKADFRQIVKMKSEYSKRFYMMLKQWELKGEKKYDVIELQNELDVPTSLLDYGQFKRRALSVAVREINLCTDLKIEMTEKKNGRNVIELHFKILKEPKQMTISDYNTDTIKTMSDGINERGQFDLNKLNVKNPKMKAKIENRIKTMKNHGESDQSIIEEIDRILCQS